MQSPNDKQWTRIAIGTALAFVAGCLIVATGFWLAADKLEQAINAHASAVSEAGQTISQPQIRIVDAIPIKDPVKIRGIQDNGSIDINARVGKSEE